MREDFFVQDKSIPNNGLIRLTNIKFEENPAILKMAEEARVAIEILNYELKKKPSLEVFLDTLYMQEARQSSSIENIETTNDELFKAVLGVFDSEETRAVHAYTDAIKYGSSLLTQKEMFNREDIDQMQALLGISETGVRKNSPKIETSLTRIVNKATGEIVYTPPHGEGVIKNLLDDMLEFVYSDDIYTIHPLIKIALAHQQFEKIHPYKDGNGRTGRIINILLMVQKNYLCAPILYASNFINTHKSEYYQFLQDCDDGDYVPFVEFTLTSFLKSAQKTLSLVNAISAKVDGYSTTEYINEERGFKGHTELIKGIIKIMFTKVYFTRKDLEIVICVDKASGKPKIEMPNKNTITAYLENFKNAGLIEEEVMVGKKGNPKIFKNVELIRIIEEENNND
ncbi:MAG: Fic family protein [Defluviitaleaceae bacterium]|nr:Fic family protein [Defluviitaleaceae bacterium]